MVHVVIPELYILKYWGNPQKVVRHCNCHYAMELTHQVWDSAWKRLTSKIQAKSMNEVAVASTTRA